MNLKINLSCMNKFLLFSAVVLSSLFFAQKSQAAFVPENKQGKSLNQANPGNIQETYSFLTGLSNREIEKLSGKKLTLREKAGLNLLRRQNKGKAAGQLTMPAEWSDKCFTMYLKNGDVLEVKLIQITPNEIKYQRCNKPDDPEIVIVKEDVFSIKDSNGEAIYSSKDEKWKTGNAVADGATDKLALASGITGIAALTLGLLFWPVGLVAGIAAGIMGIMSMSRFRTNRKLRGEGWAIVGITAGGLWVFIGILILILLAAGW
jgi:hypothetical protein